MDTTQHMSAAEFRALQAEIMRGQSPKTDVGGGKRRIVNRENSDRGHEFEDLIQRGSVYYADHGRAIVGKVYEPYRCTKKLEGGRFLGQWTGRAEPDFKGVLRGGRAVAFECKSTRKSRIQRNALTDEQIGWLEAQAEMGAAAFVCIDIQGRFFSVPWYIWRDMKDVYGKKFLMPGDIPHYEVVFDGAVKYLDYINGRHLDGDPHVFATAEGGGLDV